MGYRSDVLMAVCTGKEWADTIWAAYIIDPQVQKHDVAKLWKRATIDDKVVFYMHGEEWKWYDGYEDVQAIAYMRSLVNTLCEGEKHNPNGIYAATCYMRIGEEESDNELEVTAHGLEDNGSECEYILWDCFGVVRSLRIDITPDEEGTDDADE